MSRFRIILVLVALAALLAIIVFARRARPSLGSPSMPGAAQPSSQPRVVGAQDEGPQRRTSGADTPGTLPKGGLSVRVTDQERRGVQGALVREIPLDAAEPGVQGTTDAQGLLGIAPGLHCPARVVVTCAGFVAAEFFWEAMPTEDVWVSLQPATIISGRVISGGSSEGVGGVRILAWSDNLRMPAHDIAERAMMGEDSRALTTVADGNGSFQLEGVSPCNSYSLVAAGGGWASFATHTGVKPGEDSLLITVGALYGTRVRLEPPVGSSASALKSLAPPAVSPLQPNVPGATYLYQPCHALVLSGIREHVDYGSILDMTYLFVSNLEADVIGRAPFSVALPGFEPIALELPLSRVASQLRDTIVPLVRTHEARGHCEFRLRL